MPDAPDPPRKIYGFKAVENFERVNQAADTPSDGPTDVQGFINSANGAAMAKTGNSAANRPNEVHAMLQLNLRRDADAGLYEVSTAPDPRRIRRRRLFWIALTVVDAPLAFVAWAAGPKMAIPFVCSIGAMAMFTAVMIWRTWCLRTDA